MIKKQKTAGHAIQKSYYILVNKPFPYVDGKEVGHADTLTRVLCENVL